MPARWFVLALVLHAAGAAWIANGVAPVPSSQSPKPLPPPDTARTTLVIAQLQREAPSASPKRPPESPAVPSMTRPAPARAQPVSPPDSPAPRTATASQSDRPTTAFSALPALNGAVAPEGSSLGPSALRVADTTAHVQGPVSAGAGPSPSPAPGPSPSPALHAGRSAASAAATVHDPAPTATPRVDASWQGNLPPPYPLAARRQGVQGTVKLDLLIEADGSVSQIRMRESSGSPLLDRSVMNTVRQWRFIPARHQGQSVAAWYSNWEWVFHLQEGS